MCTDNRFELIEKYKNELVEATNIETSPEEMNVLDNILFRFWQMGWLESIDRMPLVKESAKTLIRSAGNSVSAKAFRNAGRFMQNAIDGEAPEFEKIPAEEPERKNGKWIQGTNHGLGVYNYTCSACSCTYVTIDTYNFCPNCGCQMGGTT